jgi:prepilin-type N-terminal cleavage/methylation domain-containing protein
MKNIERGKGFSLIEIIVAVSILVVLAGIAIPVVASQVNKAKAGKILALVETLRSACERYKGDTGQYTREYTTSTSATNHRLSIAQSSIPGWDGPYIDHPLTQSDNPFGGDVYIYEDLDGTGSGVRPNGFSLVGSGANTHTGQGNFLGLSNIPQDVAEMVNDALDRGTPGEWQHRGRVEFSRNQLAIYLCGGY